MTNSDTILNLLQLSHFLYKIHSKALSLEHVVLSDNDKL